MSEEDVVRIESLVSEEQELRRRGQSDSADSERLESDHRRLDAAEVALDRCRDLLRQRSALRDAGSSPGGTSARDPSTVQRYPQ